MKKILIGFIAVIVVFGMAISKCADSLVPISVLSEIKEIGENIYSEMTETGVVPVNVNASGMLSVDRLEKAAKNREEFFEQLRAELLKRKETFTVDYNGYYKDIGTSVSNMLSKINSMDSKSTSDDGDFLVGSITSMAYNVRYSSSQASYTFTVKYTDSAAQVKKLNKKIKSVFKKKGISEMSAFKKVKTIHDYVVNTVQYDRSMTEHSAYAGLVDKKHETVCQGYALIMYKMLTEAGVLAHYVTGHADGQSHSWNIVKLKGKWYYLDAAWDDPVASEPILSYKYFLVGSKTMNKDHKLSKKDKKLYKDKISVSDFKWN